MLKYLRIAVTALCLAACVLLVALWVRSYWSLDLLIGRLSKTTAIHGISSNGRLCLGLAKFSSPAGFTWTWKSTTQRQLDAAAPIARVRLPLLQLEKEYRTARRVEEQRLALALRHPSNDSATLTAKIDQLTAQIDDIDFEFKIVSLRLKQQIVTRLWGNPTQFEAQLVSEAAFDFSSVSMFWGFGAKRGTNGWIVVCPHWCPVGLIGGLAIAVGIGGWWHFSLRTLLIAMTLVATGLGIVAAF
jgi:hypothetical protein